MATIPNATRAVPDRRLTQVRPRYETLPRSHPTIPVRRTHHNPDPAQTPSVSAAASAKVVAPAAKPKPAKTAANDRIVIGLVIGLLFLRRQANLADPLIDLHLFRVPSFNMALATNMLGVFIAVGYFLFIAQYMQLVLGLSPLEAGLWSLPSAVGFVVGSNVAPRFIHRYPPAVVLGMALAISAIALALLTQVTGSSAPAMTRSLRPLIRMDWRY